jgi:uncharacterized protein YyaL (SSP411 family)
VVLAFDAHDDALGVDRVNDAVTLGEDDGAFAAEVFGVTDAGNFEHGTTVLSLPSPLAQVATATGAPLDAVRERMRSIITRLHEARSSRVAPGRDGKVITAWNALALRAFAEAGAVLQRFDYLRVAMGTADFLQQHLVRDGVVLRTWKDGVAHVAGFLEDVAHLCGAMLTLYEAAGDPRHYATAVQLAEQIVARYRDADGSFYDTASDGEALLVRPRTIDDNPVAAGQSAAAEAFLRLSALSGEERWRGYAMEIIAPLAQTIPRAPLAFGILAAAAEFSLGPIREIAVAGDSNAADTGALVDTVWRRFDPLRVLAWGAADGVPLLQDRPLRDGSATAYVCHNFVCEAPVTDVAALTQVLDAPA